MGEGAPYCIVGVLMTQFGFYCSCKLCHAGGLVLASPPPPPACPLIGQEFRCGGGQGGAVVQVGRACRMHTPAPPCGTEHAPAAASALAATPAVLLTSRSTAALLPGAAEACWMPLKGGCWLWSWAWLRCALALEYGVQDSWWDGDADDGGGGRGGDMGEWIKERNI